MFALAMALIAAGALATTVVSGCEFDRLNTAEKRKHAAVIYSGIASCLLGALLAVAASVP